MDGSVESLRALSKNFSTKFLRHRIQPTQMLRLIKESRRFASYNAAKVARKYPVGSEMYGFSVEGVLPVPELAYTAVSLKHQITGLEYLHIDRNDTNNVFSICFKTNPTDSTGLPHILEHTTLCGSEKYPVRDPFFKMLNRSLSNFMNAMTGHDYTFYPFSTTNGKDYENLRSIYFDACFNPLLSTEDFYQEGWRLEHEDPKDQKTPIVFKGVVYNEMKGQFSNNSYLFYINFLNKIYPSLHISGGDPQQITNLVHADLVDFHKSRYHPSNAKIFSYGNLPLKNNLQFLNEGLHGFGQRGKSVQVRKPIDLSRSQTVVCEGPIDPTLPEDRQYKASLTWDVGHPDNVYETFVMRMLSSLLLDGHSSLFFKKLIESGLGYDFSVNTGADSTTDLNSFTVGLQGLKESSIESLEKLCSEVLQQKADEGFEDSKVQALLRQIELSKKDKKSDFGLSLLSSLVPGWVNKVDPFDALAFDDIINDFKSNYEADPHFFSNVIKEKLLGKPVFKFVMKPDADFEKKVAEEETSRLKKKVESLDENDKQIIYNRGLALLEQQSKEEDLTCLPTLSVETDIPRTGQSFPTETNSFPEYESVSRVTDSNGLVYVRAQKDLTGKIPPHLVGYLPLFCECLLNLGTTNKTMDQLEDEIKLYTGGLSSCVVVKPFPLENTKPKLAWEIRGVALNVQAEKIYTLWEDIINNVDFNNVQKLQTLIKSMTSNSASEIASSGHSYARSLACSSLTPVAQLREYLNGVSQIKLLNGIAKISEDEEKLKTEVVSKLLDIKEILATNGDFKFGLVGDSSAIESSKKFIEKFLQGLPKKEPFAIQYDASFYDQLGSLYGAPSSLMAVDLPYQVSYASLALNGSQYLEKDSAALQVLSQLLTFKYLHKEVREKGGAYGGGVRYGAVDGLFGYYSYRDPNPMRSIEYFKKSAQYAVENPWTQDNLDEAKLTLFQGIDAPVDVKSEGMLLFSDGISEKMREERRNSLLEIDVEEVKNVAEKYLLSKMEKDEVKVAVIGPKLDSYDDKWKMVTL